MGWVQNNWANYKGPLCQLHDRKLPIRKHYCHETVTPSAYTAFMNATRKVRPASAMSEAEEAAASATAGQGSPEVGKTASTDDGWGTN